METEIKAMNSNAVLKVVTLGDISLSELRKQLKHLNSVEVVKPITHYLVTVRDTKCSLT
jgi:hypothetical protein